ncbi:hypothetical protein S101520_01746 [Lactiplantibacillus plantarum subsp. plantarum]|nr:hypothetical protein S101520_01746 [Lactiplantibacillus plantarum subsp. plantarum]
MQLKLFSRQKLLQHKDILGYKSERVSFQSLSMMLLC